MRVVIDCNGGQIFALDHPPSERATSIFRVTPMVIFSHLSSRLDEQDKLREQEGFCF